MTTATGKYYARLSFEDAATGKKRVRRVPLLDKDKKPLTSVVEAVKAFNRLKTQREDGR